MSRRMETNQIEQSIQLWCDKYRPNCFDDFKFHQKEAEHLKKLISNKNFPHLFVYGPSGSGKRTLIKALLFELFGSSSKKLKLDEKTYEAPSGKKILQKVISSNYHLEFNPSENGFYDRVVVQGLIKDVATSKSLSKEFQFKIIIIEEADNLTKEAQQSLRRTMEKYIQTCRIILLAERSSRIIPALKSRCLMLRNSAPNPEEICEILKSIKEEEQLSSVKNLDSIIEKISKNCDRNLRRAINLFEDFVENNQNYKSNDNLKQLVWQQKIEELSKKLIKTQTVPKILDIRNLLYDLQIHLVPTDVVLKTLVLKLINLSLNDQMIENLLKISAEIDHLICRGSKPVIHLELLCIKFMTMYHFHMEQLTLDLDTPMELD